MTRLWIFCYPYKVIYFNELETWGLKMKSKSVDNLKKSKMLGATLLFKQVEEFETNLQEENMRLYRKFGLQNSKVKATSQHLKA